MNDKQYILMCDCPEIQRDWQPKIGDVTTNGILTELHFLGKPCKLIFTKQECIWLPRQDQLQDMVLGLTKVKNCLTIWSMIKSFYHYMQKDEDYYVNFNSMEQLWLVFVMKERYKKQWTGKKWEKI